MINTSFSNVFENNPKHQEWLIEILRTGNITINFTKKDGTERALKCTLNEQEIPGTFAPKTENTVERKKSPDVLSVFDIENQGWRSCRWDSIKSVSIEV